jgi:hypothetical protein
MANERHEAQAVGKLESSAEKGDPAQEKALILHVVDLDKSGQLPGVAKELQKQGDAVTYNESGQVSSIDFGKVALYRQNDGDMAAVRRNQNGTVADIAYWEGSRTEFQYESDGKTVAAMTTVKPDGTRKTMDATPDRQIYVDHDGNMKLKALLGGEVEYRLSGEIRVNRADGTKFSGNEHGEFASADTVQYGDGRSRKFAYSQDQIMSFAEPSTGEVFTRGSQYHVNDQDYYSWKGSAGSTWEGAVKFLKDPSVTVSTQLQITPTDGRGTPTQPYVIDIAKDRQDVTR